mmetsp:Transcript_6890/g.8550  ORF Transcript_6890/g.8550 Transcript_6890/m.8550 type:complete len:323 (-) Transcript_6890:7-975(-)
MGNSESSNSKKKSSKKGSNKQSDGLMGERRIRTFLIGGVLIAFCVLALPYFIDVADASRQLADFFCAIDINGNNGCKRLKWTAAANAMIAAGVAIILICSALAIIFHCVNCENTIENMVGWVLAIGGLINIIGFIILSIQQSQDKLLGYTGAAFFVWIGEGILAGVTAIFLGLDVAKDFMATEETRLFYNLLNLAVVSGLCLIGYSDFAEGAASDSAPALIATGYAILLVVCIVYCVLNFCDCITCNCDDNCVVRILLAGGLIAGGLFCAVGYYTFIDTFLSGSGGNFWSYYVGYTILLVGLCVIWALDMGIVDTIKQGTKK